MAGTSGVKGSSCTGTVVVSAAIRLVGEALAHDGNLFDLFEVGAHAPRRPGPDDGPVFSGAHWYDRRAFHAREPGDGARVVAYPLASDWYPT
ncbi:hypothetical protein ACFUNF_21990 [Streptomyces sp. NPDC057291]|uniref:hypothetical protein n=1 Tax=Streptomyces sp. NPDC057291 TaxID=3346087 RepID=UPI0036375D39